MGASRGPAHLLLLDESLADHLVDGGLDKSGRNRLAVPVAVAYARSCHLLQRIVSPLGRFVRRIVGVLRKWGRRPSGDKVDILWSLMESGVENAISRWERTVQELRPDLQEIVGSLRTPAHLLSLAHSVVDEVIHDRFHMSRRDAASLSTRFGKVPHATSIAADIAPKFSDEPEDLFHRRLPPPRGADAARSQPHAAGDQTAPLPRGL